MSPALPRLNVVGAGRLGRSLARLWHERQVFQIGTVMARQEANAQQAVDFIGAGLACSALPALPAAEVWLLSVPDGQIEAVCGQLVAQQSIRPGDIVFHCSGALSSRELASARAQGASVASVHPMRSFAIPEEVVCGFTGTFCAAEGDQLAMARLSAAFTQIGSKIIPVQADQKAVYHAAGVFASNYLVTLIDAALQACMQAGIAREVALEMLTPLAENSLRNALQAGPERALSGPIARGDWNTVEHQQRALDQALPELGSLYRALVLPTADLAQRQAVLHKQDASD